MSDEDKYNHLSMPDKDKYNHLSMPETFILTNTYTQALEHKKKNTYSYTHTDIVTQAKNTEKAFETI